MGYVILSNMKKKMSRFLLNWNNNVLKIQFPTFTSQYVIQSPPNSSDPMPIAPNFHTAVSFSSDRQTGICSSPNVPCDFTHLGPPAWNVLFVHLANSYSLTKTHPQPLNLPSSIPITLFTPPSQ